MSGFLQRLVDGAAELPPMAAPTLRSASPIFSYDQRLGIPGFEGIAGFDWNAGPRLVDAPAPDAPPVRSETAPVRPAPVPMPASREWVDVTEPTSLFVPPPQPPITPTKEMPPRPAARAAVADMPQPPASDPPVAAPAPSPAAVAIEAKRPGAESVPPEPVLPRPANVPAAGPEPPRLVHSAPAPASEPVRSRPAAAPEPPARPERAMLVDVARARDSEPEPAASAPRKVGELRPALRLPAMTEAPPELPPPRSETRSASVRVAEKVIVEAPRPPKPQAAPPPKPLTAASASIIGSLEGMRRQNRIFALRQL